MKARRSASRWRVWAAEAGAALGGSVLALVLLWYLHGEVQPAWALLCGVLAGVVLRRTVRPGYAAFPAYLRAPLGVGVVVVGAIVASWATLVRQPSSYWLLRWREAITLPLLAAALGVGLVGVIYSHARMRREIEQARAREAASREAALRARLRALQAQINPHFLFNAFNALAELTHVAPDVAERLIGDLAHLLRYTLRASAETTVPLRRELEAVDRYLRIEQARLGDRLRISREIHVDIDAVRVPGLLLQPLVENAVRHAVAPRPEGGRVRIRIDRAGAEVRIRVEDDGPGLPPAIRAQLALAAAGTDASAGAPPGVGAPGSEAVDEDTPPAGTGGAGGGLANVVQRLALRYRGAARVRVEDAAPGVRVELRIPQ